ncbi:CHASE2 domain-containing protein [Aestuariivirga sp.]|uniref:CHASE2 domain-containing protein n=1 Tax=Aestuariivirga sp. TaxID=2650926 RepID=UPI0039E31D26
MFGIKMGQVAAHRVKTFLIAAFTVLAMLAGFGQRVLDSHNGLGDADHLVALSLTMSGVPKEALPVTFLDVDDRTRSLWGATSSTPHAALAELIRMSETNKAAAILVDFDLSPSIEGQAADPQLSALLRSYPADAPLLLLVRKIGFTKAQGTAMAAGDGPTLYDADVARKPNIRWVTTLNDIGGDRSVRRLKLWQTVCDGANGVAYPAAVLVMSALPVKGVSHDADLKAFLDAQVKIECGHEEAKLPPWPPVTSAVAQIPFVFADTAGAPAMFRITRDGQQVVALRRISAAQLVTMTNDVAAPAGDIDADPFANRAVILGASHADSGDIYATPFGNMPGALVLANSVVQAKAIVETVPASPFFKNVLAVILFIILAYIARTFIGAVAIIALSLVTLAALFIISRWFSFATGIDVVSVAVPGFALFKLFDSLMDIASHVPRKGWRAILR